MTTNVLIEELGPRGRRRVRIGTGVATVVAVLVVFWMYLRLEDNGQLEAVRWTDLFAESTFRFLGEGLVATIRAAITAGVVATAVGFGLALLHLSKSRPARMFAVGWVELFRALPLLLMIFGVFFIDTSIARGRGGDALLGTFWSVVVALVLYNSAVLSEIFRVGVRSLDSGQSEAAQAVGMTYWQMMFVVVLPQAVRRMVPAIVAQMATLTKDVSLGFVIGYEEFVRRGAGTPNFGDTEVTNFQAYVSIGVVYFILVWAMARLARWLDERQSTAPKVAATGTPDEDLEVGAGDTLGAGPA
ncbi:amino acid ABC transporter permease [Actinospongicola halichondriae]|uniref:amino acid ABC transporter permease n=1 Tax=Actinospongicola halichondriae TaxID=3236844 RepID=UPI003D40E300